MLGFRSAIIGLAACALLAQETVIRVTTRMVEINVIVHDHNGVVRGLTKDDFSISDRGKPQKIAFFSMNSTDRAAAASPAAPASAAPANVIRNRSRLEADAGNITVVLLDALNTRIQDQVYAKQEFVKFLSQIRPDDHIAVYTLGNELRVLQDFSNDSRHLVAAVAKYRGQNLPFVDTSEPDPADSGDLDLDKRLNDLLGGMADQAIINRVRLTSSALISIANHLQHLPGRKNLVWISASFPFSLGACGGENPTDWNAQIAELEMQANGTPGQFNCMAPTASMNTPVITPKRAGGGARSVAIPPGGPSAFMNPTRENVVFGTEIRRAMRALNSADVAIYPVDARGLISMPKQFSAAMGSVNRAVQGGGGPAPHADLAPTGISVMKMVAEETGGEAFFNTNDIHGAIRKAVDDADVTYTLGFYPDSKTLDFEYHSLKVHVDRKGVEVRARKGYIASPDVAITEDDREQKVLDALWSPIAATGIGFTAKADHVNADGLRVALTVDLAELQFNPEEGKRRAEIEVAFEQRSADGHGLGRIERIVPVTLDEDRYQSKEPITVTKTLALAGQVAEIRVAVYDRQSGNLGSMVIPVKRGAK